MHLRWAGPFVFCCGGVRICLFTGARVRHAVVDASPLWLTMPIIRGFYFVFVLFFEMEGEATPLGMLTSGKGSSMVKKENKRKKRKG
ncbi:MAG: hypothetical protein J3R72DRAFT_447836 [Linnemannia gamsii]|nr:MAG: hypothetical protein J3R72DRAFT_447836 [Linnemannia gamsii]